MNIIHNRYNFFAAMIFIALLCALCHSLSLMVSSAAILDNSIKLDIASLVGYTFRTSSRILVAIVASTIFAAIYAIVAAKNTRIRRILIPILDIFQSIPVFGYISATVVMFINLTPGNMLGFELATIFAIFTAQVWNIIFSAYQSFITIPATLTEIAAINKLNKWQIFWKIELPFAIPGIIWNIALSITSSWFYIVAQEAIFVGPHRYNMPGVGSYIALALKNSDVCAIFYAVVAIGAALYFINIFLLKPLVLWSYKFRYEFDANDNNATTNDSTVAKIFQRSNIFDKLINYIKQYGSNIAQMSIPSIITKYYKIIILLLEMLFWTTIALSLIWGGNKIYLICAPYITINEVLYVFTLGFYTATRVFACLLIASAIWVPIGIFIGMRPRISSKLQLVIQFFSSFPANLYYPIFAILIIQYQLNPQIWLSLIIITSSQWCILYNVISGTLAIPAELLEAAAILKLPKKSRILKVILPCIFPYYVTGLITAAGASWNASVVAEIITWNGVTLFASGLGSYIANAATAGNFFQIILGVIVMVLFVVTINRLIWKPLYQLTCTKLHIE